VTDIHCISKTSHFTQYNKNCQITQNHEQLIKVSNAVKLDSEKLIKLI